MGRTLDLRHKTALVTGASSGIGRAIAEVLARDVATLVLVARRRERLDALAKELIAKHPALRVIVRPVDLTDRAATEGLLDTFEVEGLAIDVLVNNAGFGDLGVFDLSAWSRTEQMIALNVTSLAYLTHRLAGPMVSRGRGAIANIGSGLGLTFSPGMASYVGTKHFVTGFTEALRLDLAGTGVRVTLVCPGPVRTEFNEVAGNFTGLEPPALISISPERCARAVVRAIDRGRALVVPGVAVRLLIALGVLCPRWLLRLAYRPIARALRKKQLAVRGAPVQ